MHSHVPMCVYFNFNSIVHIYLFFNVLRLLDGISTIYVPDVIYLYCVAPKLRRIDLLHLADNFFHKMWLWDLITAEIFALNHISLRVCVGLWKCRSVVLSRPVRRHSTELRDVASDKKLFFCEFERTLPYLRKKIYLLLLPTTHRII